MNGEEWRNRICMETDTGYSYSLAKRMEQYRTNPVLGYRTAGSRAEFETGEMLVREMESLGLSDVHKDRICVDSWEFEKAVMVLQTAGAGSTGFNWGLTRLIFIPADSGNSAWYIWERERRQITERWM